MIDMPPPPIPATQVVGPATIATGATGFGSTDAVEFCVFITSSPAQSAGGKVGREIEWHELPPKMRAGEFLDVITYLRERGQAVVAYDQAINALSFR